MFTILLIVNIAFSPDIFVSGRLLPKMDGGYHYLCKIDTQLLSVESVYKSELVMDVVKESPNDKFVAFTEGREPGKGVTAVSRLRVVDGNDKIIHEVPDVTNSFSWSPDSSSIAYCERDGESRRPNGNMYIFNISDGSKKKIPFSGYKIYWSAKNGKILFLSDKIYETEDPFTSAKPALLPSLDLSPTEDYCMKDADHFEVYRVHDHTTSDKVAVIAGLVNEVPSWLNGHLLRTYKSHVDDQINPFWYIFDCKANVLFQTEDVVVAADEEDSILMANDDKIIRVPLQSLRSVPLDTLKIQLVTQSKSASGK